MTHPRPFRFGVQLASAASGSDWTALAREAEDLGFSSLLAADHFDDQLAPLPALMAAAAATTRLRVGSLVLDNDYKHPVVTAKEAATLDLLSDGRLELGLGAGWMTTDYERSGIELDPPSVRIDRLEEALAVLKGLFEGEPFSFEGKHYTISELAGTPLPAQRPHPPLIIGGGGPRLLGLAAREADIVGINPNLRSGKVDEATARDGVAATTDRKVTWVREAAGERYADIELNFLIFACVVTDDRPSTLEAFASAFGLSPDELADYPHAWVGSEEEICEQLQEARRRWDTSYFVVQGPDAMRTAAPIVARLTGQ
jgi:probable F420-dependent oxidoreductase